MHSVAKMEHVHHQADTKISCFRRKLHAHIAAWMDSSTAPWWNMCFTALTGTSLASAGMQDVYVTAAEYKNQHPPIFNQTLQCMLHNVQLPNLFTATICTCPPIEHQSYQFP